MIKKFKDEHIVLVNEWMKQKDLPIITRSALPEIGFVYFEYQDAEPMAILFMRRCEGNIGMLDSLITNSDACSEDRHKAINKLVDHTIDYANRHYQFSKLLVLTKEECIRKRALDKGFQLIENQVVMSKTRTF